MPFPSRQLAPEDYPAGLREIPEPPKALWARGQWPTLSTKILAVVGSRALTPYGREACEYLIAGLAGYPISIISGLALGADACAHRAALKAGLHTIAVPGSGLGDAVIAPRTNAPLATEILTAGGLLLSEHEDTYVPRAYDFPSRNRIMVGLAHAILVIEAGPKSGTLITARLASEYNRELLIVPHRIGDTHGFAAHLFGRLGATLIAEPSHILEALSIEPAMRTDAVSLNDDEQYIYALLSTPRSRDEVVRMSRCAPDATMTALVMLELKGLAKETYSAWRRV